MQARTRRALCLCTRGLRDHPPLWRYHAAYCTEFGRHIDDRPIFLNAPDFPHLGVVVSPGISRYCAPHPSAKFFPCFWTTMCFCRSGATLSSREASATQTSGRSGTASAAAFKRLPCRKLHLNHHRFRCVAAAASSSVRTPTCVQGAKPLCWRVADIIRYFADIVPRRAMLLAAAVSGRGCIF